MEKEIIDINYARLLDWVTQRKLVDNNWNVAHQKVRGKIQAALDTIPADSQVGKLPPANQINYSLCKKIIELLQRTESSEKSWGGWGGFKSKTLNSWASVVTDYEKQLLYIAEASQYLSRAVDFEFPALKKDVTRVEQQIAEMNKKESDYQRSANDFDARYKKSCADLGIEGTNKNKLAHEIRTSAKSQLPVALEKVASLATDTKMQKALQYYNAFVKFSLDSAEFTTSDEVQCPTLSFLVEHVTPRHKS